LTDHSEVDRSLYLVCFREEGNELFGGFQREGNEFVWWREGNEFVWWREGNELVWWFSEGGE
jgi:hypothetical protein